MLYTVMQTATFFGHYPQLISNSAPIRTFLASWCQGTQVDGEVQAFHDAIFHETKEFKEFSEYIHD